MELITLPTNYEDILCILYSVYTHTVYSVKCILYSVYHSVYNNIIVVHTVLRLSYWVLENHVIFNEGCKRHIWYV